MPQLSQTRGRVQDPHIPPLRGAPEGGRTTLSSGRQQGRELERTWFFVASLSHVCVLSRVRLSATPWTVAPASLHGPWDAPSKNTGAGGRALQSTFPNPRLLPRQADSSALSHLGSSVHNTVNRKRSPPPSSRERGRGDDLQRGELAGESTQSCNTGVGHVQ